jgi:hypothetical protein
MMGRHKRDRNHSPAKNKLVQNSDGNEENRYPVPDPKKTKIDYPKESNEAHKNILKEEILQEITKNFMEMLLDNVNQNIQEHSRNSKTKTKKEYKKTQKQISELIGALNKYQSETETTINRELNELRAKIDISNQK